VWQLTGTHLDAAAEAGCTTKGIALANPSTMKKRLRIFNPPEFSLVYLLDCFTPGPTVFRRKRNCRSQFLFLFFCTVVDEPALPLLVHSWCAEKHLALPLCISDWSHTVLQV
jgi:hypothetical protein